MTFHPQNSRGLLPPSTIPNAKFPGIFVMDTLDGWKQIEYILQICNQRLYLLNQLKNQGLAKQQLLNVFNAIGMSRITYAAAAWREFASPAECNSIQIFINKVKRWRIMTEKRSIIDVFDAVDYNLFRNRNAVITG